ncbi:hypothetical protein NLJ89_g9111 [Agrocybe chaxingu]|uniref:Uncharacterized protein n=1 Tax=Agrocybe chaxingu TaxID=84603 RepID=A0A9W8JRE5_9AGAR|nr:hypothetical protein NLJ89_g9111 [Agrocybe chaxingu]
MEQPVTPISPAETAPFTNSTSFDTVSETTVTPTNADIHKSKPTYADAGVQTEKATEVVIIERGPRDGPARVEICSNVQNKILKDFKLDVTANASTDVVLFSHARDVELENADIRVHITNVPCVVRTRVRPFALMAGEEVHIELLARAPILPFCVETIYNNFNFANAHQPHYHVLALSREAAGRRGKLTLDANFPVLPLSSTSTARATLVLVSVDDAAGLPGLRGVGRRQKVSNIMFSGGKALASGANQRAHRIAVFAAADERFGHTWSLGGVRQWSQVFKDGRDVPHLDDQPDRRGEWLTQGRTCEELRERDGLYDTLHNEGGHYGWEVMQRSETHPPPVPTPNGGLLPSNVVSNNDYVPSTACGRAITRYVNDIRVKHAKLTLDVEPGVLRFVLISRS